jgi:TRAP-type transport system small permease protein
MRKLHEGLIRAEVFLAATLLVLMVLLIFLGGVMRMAGYPINWSTDFATAFFAWACFLCADLAWRKNSLMAIEFLPRALPPKAQKVLRLANYFIIAGFLAYLIVMGAWLSWTSRVRSFQGIPEISYSWVTSSAVVGGFLLLVTTILKIRDALRSRGWQDTEAQDVV